MEQKKLLIIGAGGHGRVVADIAARTGVYGQIAFLDDVPPQLPSEYTWLGTTEQAEQFLDRYSVIVAIGNGKIRRRIMERLEVVGARFATVIAPEAVIGSHVQIMPGTVVMPAVVVNTGTVIGKGVILNTACTVDHDCNVANYAHISVGAHLCGVVSIGENTWVGAGAVVSNNLSVCPDCMIGAGAAVVTNTEQPGTYVGVPAKRKV